MPEKQPTAQERRRECDRRYYQKHRKEILQKQKNEEGRKARQRYHQKHREELNRRRRERRRMPEIQEHRREYYRRYYQKHREEILQKQKHKDQINRTKQLAYKKKYRQEHKIECQATINRWRKAHPEAMRMYGVRNQNAIRAKKQQASGRFKTKDIKELLELQQGKCAICQKTFPPPGTLRRYDVDHIVSMSQGGSNTRNNIQLLCPSCNRRKG
jgi:5-methylcytosine-specific restriction endonuclease McrA